MSVAEKAAPSETEILLMRCAASDAEAFRRLYQVSLPRLYNLAMRIVRHPQLASDAVHDAMLQVWHNAARYDPHRGNAEAWLNGLVRYRAIDNIQRYWRETTGVDIIDSVDEEADALSSLVSADESLALQACLAEIAPERRNLVVLAFINGMTHAEIAAQTGLPLGTVKSSIRRALIALKACLSCSTI
jgi:RNA polymerase sigma-70 factor (ECF subfamily)